MKLEPKLPSPLCLELLVLEEEEMAILPPPEEEEAIIGEEKEVEEVDGIRVTMFGRFEPVLNCCVC